MKCEHKQYKKSCYRKRCFGASEEKCIDVCVQCGLKKVAE
jgi:hypothetical protein